MGLLDELHEHSSHEISTKIRAGAKRRPQPLFAEITNSGYDRTSICWQRHEHARKTLEGLTEDDRLFAYVCGLDEGDDPLTDEACWPKTNPYLGVTVTDEYLRQQVSNAKNIPSETNQVLRLNFCTWTQSQSQFFDRVKWMGCSADVPDAELVGVPCYGAFDLGETDDFTAWVRIWLLPDGHIATRCRFWIPAAAKDKYRDRPYGMWPSLAITDGDVTDFTLVQEAIIADVRASGVQTVGFDKRFAQQMAQNLMGEGITVVDIPQGFWLTEAIRLVSQWVVEGRLRHGNDQVLAWMADNAAVRVGPDQRVRLDKESSREKIDGIVALVMAAQLVIAQPKDEPSIYTTRGLITLGAP
jgi:phage terminase large subunit-like protein